MRYQGKITKWNIEKGFGFVLPNGGNKEVFLHISAFKSRNHQPQISQLITYELVKDESGRDRACNASSVASKNLKSSSSDKAEISFLFILFIGLSSTFILERIFVGALPFEYLFVYLIANLAAFLYYYIDKTAALKVIGGSLKIHYTFSAFWVDGLAHISRKKCSVTKTKKHRSNWYTKRQLSYIVLSSLYTPCLNCRN